MAHTFIRQDVEIAFSEFRKAAFDAGVTTAFEWELNLALNGTRGTVMWRPYGQTGIYPVDGLRSIGETKRDMVMFFRGAKQAYVQLAKANGTHNYAAVSAT